jgi:hypothetical protein
MIASAQYSVDGTAVKIAASGYGYRTVHVHNIGNAAIYVNGASSVTTSTGFYIDKGAGPQLYLLAPQDELWCIAGGTAQTVTVLITGP